MDNNLLTEDRAVEPGIAASDELGPLTGGRLVVGAIAVSLAMFMNVLDTTIANVSIPTIAGDMGISASQGTWIITAYAVALAISLPIANWLAIRFGRVRAFVVSVLLFTLTSLLCGLADNYWMLVVARALQGASAGPMIPLSQVLLLRAFPSAKANVALAVWSMTLTLAPVIGPTLGGVIVDNWSWPWIFYINVPVGLLSAVLTWWIFRDRETQTKPERLDLAGLLLLILFAGCLQIALDTGHEHDWFDSDMIQLLFVLSIVGFVAFLVRELSTYKPLVDLSLFTNRNFLVGTVALTLSYAIAFASLVMIPMWLQLSMSYTATWAGLAMAPVGLTSFLMAPLIARLVKLIDVRLIVTFSMFVLAYLSGWRAQLTTNASFWVVAMPQFMLGLSMATMMAPLTGLAISNLQGHQLTSASGQLGFCRIIGGAIAVALAATLLDRRTADHRFSLSAHISDYDAGVAGVIKNMEMAGMHPPESYAVLDGLLSGQASMLAFNDFSLLSAVAALLVMFVVWFAKVETKTNKK